MYFSLGVKERREDFYDMERELETLVRELRDPLTRMIVIKESEGSESHRS